jgi:hypothetical protein
VRRRKEKGESAVSLRLFPTPSHYKFFMAGPLVRFRHFLFNGKFELGKSWYAHYLGDDFPGVLVNGKRAFLWREVLSFID